jgi:two-component system alkaline phosphatase synthesis response regulator PhoP
VNTAAPRILLAEDEQHLAMGITDNLVAEGYVVAVVADGAAALSHMQHNEVDLLVLDVMLPKVDGYSVCRSLRAEGNTTPILFLTAKNSAQERVHGLTIGGDDYLGKPFHLGELLGRVAALLRRRAWHQGAPAKSCAPLTLGGVHIDFDRLQMQHPDGHVEEVPVREMAILKLLHSRMGEVVSRDAILDAVWGHDVYPSSRTVDNFIVRLRRRFEPDVSAPRYLFTVRGVGYRLAHEDMPS